MRFRQAINATPGLSNAYRPGIQALKEADRRRVDCSDTRRLAGSVNLEGSLNIAGGPVWDYGIGWRNPARDHAIWIEVHPATSDHVGSMVDKARWLKQWLRTSAPDLAGITRPEDGYVWIASGGVSLQRGSRQARQLAAEGVSFPRERLRLI